MTLNFQTCTAFLYPLGVGIMGTIESMLLLPPSSADPWLSANGHGFLHICFIRAASCQYSGPGRVLTSWWESVPYLSVTLGCWITKLEAGSVLGPTVMVGKVEYYNPDSKARLRFASRRLLQEAIANCTIVTGFPEESSCT